MSQDVLLESRFFGEGFGAFGWGEGAGEFAVRGGVGGRGRRSEGGATFSFVATGRSGRVIHFNNELDIRARVVLSVVVMVMVVLVGVRMWMRGGGGGGGGSCRVG